MSVTCGTVRLVRYDHGNIFNILAFPLPSSHILIERV